MKTVLDALHTAQQQLATSYDQCSDDEAVLWNLYEDAVKVVQTHMDSCTTGTVSQLSHAEARVQIPRMPFLINLGK